MLETYKYDVQVVGNGPAGIGIPLSILGSETERSCCVIGPKAQFGKGALDYNIAANSAADDFLEPIPDALKLAVAQLKATERLAAIGSGSPELELVADFQSGVAKVLKEHFEQNQRDPFDFGQRISHFKSAGYKRLISYDEQGVRIAESDNVVIAIGGEQQPLDLGLNQPKLQFSDDWLRYDLATLKTLCKGKKITIVGGSHSAFSVADNIKQVGTSERVNILHRSPIKPFYATELEAQAAGYDYDSTQLDDGKVNRFDGLRGKSQDLFNAVKSGGDDLVKLLKAEEDLNNQPCLDEADIIIQATGYRPRRLPIYDAFGYPVESCLDSAKNLSTAFEVDGSQVFYHGLGVTPRDGVNLFQQSFAQRILEGLNEPLSEIEATLHHIVRQSIT